MHDLAPLIYDLGIMLSVAAIVTILFQRIHQPVVLGYLIAGMIIGPYTPPHALVSDLSNIQILSQLGVIFLMFSLGLEFSFQKLTRVGFSASVIGLIEVILMIALGFGAGMLMGWSYYDSLFLGAALSISSTTIIIKAIADLRLKTKRFAELIFGVLIVEDLLAILLLVALSTLVLTNHFFSFEMLSAASQLILVVGAWFIIGYFIVPPLFREIANYINNETLTIVSVALCLFLVCIAAYFNYSTALGAFIMGSILAETILVHRIEELIAPVRDIFAAVFFVSIGMLIDPNIILQNWESVLMISALTVFGKIITTTTGALLTGQSINTSLRVGFGMAQIGEFSFIIVALGASLNVTNTKIYPLIVAVSAITTFTTPYLIRVSGIISNKIESKLPKPIKQALAHYASWVYRAQTNPSKLNTSFITLRYVVNALIIAIVFAGIDKIVFHQLKLFNEELFLPNLVFLIIAMLISSPFIWGMLFAVKENRIIVWLLTFLELTFLSIIYFETLPTILFIFITSIALFLLGYKQLGKAYAWFETQFVSNIQTDNKPIEDRYNELAPWETHLVEFEVGDLSVLVDKKLESLQLRQRFGINIVAIAHGERIIPAPRGDEKIIARDKLIVLGSDKQLEAFQEELSTPTVATKPRSFLNNFKLKAIILEPGHPLIGKSIRNSDIREKIKGMVVGLERNGVRILNPDPTTKLEEEDMILLVGETSKLKKLAEFK